jgi:hypothetical protein
VPKIKVVEFFKLYKNALGLKFRSSKFAALQDSLLMFWNILLVIIKIIELIGTWRITQENSATTILHGFGLN